MSEPFSKGLGNGLSGLGQTLGGLQNNYVEPEDIKFFRSYVEAKQAFDSACQTLVKAQEHKAMCEKKLAELNQQVIDRTKLALHDPTQPRVEQAYTENACDNGAYYKKR